MNERFTDRFRVQTDEDRKAVVRFLGKIGDKVYVPLFLNSSVGEFSNLYEDWVQALKFFLSGYAFERQGRSPDYAPTAVAAVDQVLPAGRSQRSPGPGLPDSLWQAFCRIGRYLPPENVPTKRSHKGKGRSPNPYLGANAKTNPLYPKDGKDVVSVCWLRLEGNGYNLCAFARSALMKQQPPALSFFAFRRRSGQSCSVWGSHQKCWTAKHERWARLES